MNYVKTFVLLLALTILFLVVGQVLGGQQGMAVAFIMAVVMNFVSYWFSHKIILMIYRARPAEESDYPQLHRIVRNLTQVAGLPMPKIYIIPTQTPNAFATGRNPENAVVACTEGILRLLNEKELAGVIGHELGHVKNRDILISSIAATVAGAIMMLANMARWAAMFGGRGDRDRENSNPYVGLAALLATAILAPLAAMLIQAAISRSREYAADASGAKTCGDPLALASALRKLEAGVTVHPLSQSPTATAHLFIVHPFSGKSMLNIFSTHPPTEDRIDRLEKMVGRI
ncbi:MAG TPA: zinc metalloprotease HtpX [Elusimicrobiota bacterium]|nr:zinc metalloprotease HtpX [Elusimicrobiota bacterium]